jgi:hypothetical protein
MAPAGQQTDLSGRGHRRGRGRQADGCDGVVHFDFKPPRTEDDNGVWDSAAACMRNYLILREKVRAFRSDPEVRQALREPCVKQLAIPTLADGETWRDVAGSHRILRASPVAVGSSGAAIRGLAWLPCACGRARCPANVARLRLRMAICGAA